MYDIIIIGAGPSGLTAGIYSARAGKKVLILEGYAIGGQIASSPLVENYPSQAQISGSDLVDKMYEQAESCGCDFECEKVTSVEKGTILKVITEYNTYECYAIIIATGSKPRHIRGLDEEKYLGHGIGYCVMCDGDFYKGQITGVLGGGNTAVQNALYLSNICPKVYLFQNLPQLTCEETLKKRIKAKENIEIICNAQITKLLGENKLEQVELNVDGQNRLVDINGLFISIGQEPNNAPFTNLVAMDRMGYIIGNEFCQTNVPGIYVAGDCRTKTIRQLTTATADGSISAIYACSYVDEQKAK